MLVGPNGQPVSAVGLSKSSGNPYSTNNGPKLIGAKLSVMNETGQCGPGLFNGNFPNSGIALYGPDDAQYRLRLYTTAGTSPDGVAAILPCDFSKFFRIKVTNQGATEYLTQTNHEYHVNGGIITVLGLADLAKTCTPQNGAYVADRDNYIDIVLKASTQEAVQSITAVEIPADGVNYAKLYNPGGPGNNPTPGVIYTQPGPSWTQPVTMAITHPQTVTYNPNNIQCPTYTYIQCPENTNCPPQ